MQEVIVLTLGKVTFYECLFISGWALISRPLQCFAQVLLSQPSPFSSSGRLILIRLCSLFQAFHADADYGTSSPGDLSASSPSHLLSLLSHKDSEIVAGTNMWDSRSEREEKEVVPRVWLCTGRQRFGYARGGSGNLERVQDFSFYKP